MKQSIIQKDDCCYICGSPRTEVHHVYFGRNRKASDENGFIVRLCPEHHRGDYGVHGKHGHQLDMFFKRLGQIKFEKTHSREEFIKIIGRSYL